MQNRQREQFAALITLIALAVVGIIVNRYTLNNQERNAAALASIQEVAEVDGSRFAWQTQLAQGSAADFVALTRDGTEVRLSSFLGEVVFLNFWATNCAPCRKEMPDLQRLAEKTSGLPFRIVAVTTDKDWNDVDQMLPNGLPGVEILMDPTGGDIRRSFGTEKIPESYLIDKSGKLRLRFVSVHPWTDDRIFRFIESLANDT